MKNKALKLIPRNLIIINPIKVIANIKLSNEYIKGIEGLGSI